MRRMMLAAAAALALAGCAEGYGGYGYGGGGIAYYDDFYGPFYDGYWGRGDVYYYRNNRHGPWTADQSHHFRRDQTQGFHGVQGHGGTMGFHHGPPQGAPHGGAPGGGGPRPH